MAGLSPQSSKKRSAGRKDSESTPQDPPSFPRFVPTMQPTMADKPPEGAGWIFELKYDGYRTQLSIAGGRARAFTRGGHDWTERYGSIITSAGRLNCQTALIDGEVCVQDQLGVTDFGALPNAIARDQERLVYFAFDLLELDGQDLRKAPIEERRARLRWLLTDAPGNIHISDEYEGDGRRFFELVDGMGLEGIVAKRKGSLYSSGPTRSWLKIKCWHTATFDVIGVTRGDDGVPYALLSEDGVYRGAAFVSLPMSLREVFWRYVESRGMETPSVAGMGRKKAIWVQPGMRAAVKHLKGGDKLRHATISGIEIGDPGK